MGLQNSGGSPAGGMVHIDLTGEAILRAEGLVAGWLILFLRAKLEILGDLIIVAGVGRIVLYFGLRDHTHLQKGDEYEGIVI